MAKTKSVRKNSSPKKPKKVINKPFADGTMSSSAFFSMIRSCLRQKSRWWHSIKVCKEREKRFFFVKKKYTLNENYFSNIDTEDKAYFLGLLYADGCVSRTYNNNIQIALQAKDGYILEKFKECINSDKPLYNLPVTEVKGFKNMNKQYFRKAQILFAFASLRIKNDLKKLGLESNKSLTIEFKEILSTNLMHHFIRGIFDGDGCISTSDKNKWVVSIAGNENFCTSLSNYLKSYNLKCFVKKHLTLNVFYIYIYGRLNCIDFYNYIYDSSTIYLKRKFDKFQECIKSTNNIRHEATWKKEKTIN